MRQLRVTQYGKVSIVTEAGQFLTTVVQSKKCPDQDPGKK